MKKLTKETLDACRSESQRKRGNWIKVGMSTCGIAAGAADVFAILQNEAQKRNLDVRVEKCGCAGMCFAEPLVEVYVEGMPQVVYGDVNKETALAIIDKHISGKRLLNDHIYNVKVDKQ